MVLLRGEASGASQLLFKQSVSIFFDSITKWCSPPKRQRSRRGGKSVNFKNYWSSNKTFIIFMTCYVLLNLSLFAWRLYVFSDFKNVDGQTMNIWVMMARGNGNDVIVKYVLLTLVSINRLCLEPELDDDLDLYLEIHRHLDEKDWAGDNLAPGSAHHVAQVHRNHDLLPSLVAWSHALCQLWYGCMTTCSCFGVSITSSIISQHSMSRMNLPSFSLPTSTTCQPSLATTTCLRTAGSRARLRSVTVLRIGTRTWSGCLPPSRACSDSSRAVPTSPVSYSSRLSPSWSLAP